MKVIPARSRELHIDLHSWNESNWSGDGRLCQTPYGKYYGKLTSLFTEVSVMAVSHARHFENKGELTLV